MSEDHSSAIFSSFSDIKDAIYNIFDGCKTYSELPIEYDKFNKAYPSFKRNNVLTKKQLEKSVIVFKSLEYPIYILYKRDVYMLAPVF
jgi:hypothetical protein